MESPLLTLDECVEAIVKLEKEMHECQSEQQRHVDEIDKTVGNMVKLHSKSMNAVVNYLIDASNMMEGYSKDHEKATLELASRDHGWETCLQNIASVKTFLQDIQHHQSFSDVVDGEVERVENGETDEKAEDLKSTQDAGNNESDA